MKKLIYNGAHDSVTFADTGQVAVRHGDPVERDDHAALLKLKEGDEPVWVEADPEPSSRKSSKSED